MPKKDKDNGHDKPQHQRKSVEYFWNGARVGTPQDTVRLQVELEEDKWRTVRWVDNKPNKDGTTSATVTFPDAFTGERKMRAKGPDGIDEGEIKVK